ncbi:hypothetical protein OO006_12560 [Prosthecochloris sp. SCSIO W1101]|uniref:hypothetical protein n=1 Tax=Prosthecochloris sp. SCSIO W1101 TaxID=2992242 RepID=UPI00223D8EE0|nr:hypothetical protein [Prosthecochloris sp. SCSIO W1101]UZJ41161.1 hypothetical protein OO006_12560 [Prosthecochloris sp. SCSIO W1101]
MSIPSGLSLCSNIIFTTDLLAPFQQYTAQTLRTSIKHELSANPKVGFDTFYPNYAQPHTLDQHYSSIFPEPAEPRFPKAPQGLDETMKSKRVYGTELRGKQRGSLIGPTMSLYLVILGLDPGIHLPMKICRDAASSAA